jgi:hypothetical protein
VWTPSPGIAKATVLALLHVRGVDRLTEAAVADRAAGGVGVIGVVLTVNVGPLCDGSAAEAGAQAG